MIVVGFLGLAIVIAICAWVVLRDQEGISRRVVQERARSLTALAEAVRRQNEDRSASP